MPLTVRIGGLFALIACVALASVGMSLYDATRAALSKRADYQLIARVEHMRSLLHDLYTVQQIEARPALFETMLGDEQDIFVFRRPGAAPFIDVNPQSIPVPNVTSVPPDRQITLAALHEGQRADGLRMRWVIAQAHVGPRDGASAQTVEIAAAHVMTQEEKVLDAYRLRVIWTVIGAVLATALLASWALQRSLRPLREMAQRTAEITPEKLAVRLDIDGTPRELRQLASSFNAMLDRLESGYSQLLQFSADLAHEIRTPIGALIGQTQVTLVHSRSTIEYRSVLESNLEELERLARIAENILFLAQADHQRHMIERTTLSLTDELDTIQMYFEGLADERGLRFDVSIGAEVDAGLDADVGTEVGTEVGTDRDVDAYDAEPAAMRRPAAFDDTLRANAIMCRRAISNVVVNAVRYAVAGSVITLKGIVSRDRVVIVVGNQAVPIAPQTLARLFDRFYRGDSSRSAFTESSGLGLPIVRAIMLLHEGNATISCTPNGWVEVTLTFPQQA